jgi:hypothetical protein
MPHVTLAFNKFSRGNRLHRDQQELLFPGLKELRSQASGLSLAAITWRPGFHDNDLPGWLLTAGYLIAIALCFQAAKRATQSQIAPESLLKSWHWVGVLLLLLGLNQQLDLQTLLVQVGRELAASEGWYGHRRLAQKLFFFGFAIILFVLSAYLASRWRLFFRRLPLVALGLAILLGWLILSAANINHLGENVSTSIHLERWRDYWELAGLGLIILGIGKSNSLKAL